VGTNGNRKPPRARIELVTPAASASEAAAIVAAVEQFVRDTQPEHPRRRGRGGGEAFIQSPWQRAALEEGIAARQVSGAAWGHAPR
jgi:hypothetical protein